MQIFLSTESLEKFPLSANDREPNQLYEVSGSLDTPYVALRGLIDDKLYGGFIH